MPNDETDGSQETNSAHFTHEASGSITASNRPIPSKHPPSSESYRRLPDGMLECVPHYNHDDPPLDWDERLTYTDAERADWLAEGIDPPPETPRAWGDWLMRRGRFAEQEA